MRRAAADCPHQPEQATAGPAAAGAIAASSKGSSGSPRAYRGGGTGREVDGSRSSPGAQLGAEGWDREGVAREFEAGERGEDAIIAAGMEGLNPLDAAEPPQVAEWLAHVFTGLTAVRATESASFLDDSLRRPGSLTASAWQRARGVPVADGARRGAAFKPRPPSADDGPGMQRAWFAHCGRPVGAWANHLRSSVAEREASEEAWRCTAEVVACDNHTVNCESCSSTRLVRGRTSAAGTCAWARSHKDLVEKASSDLAAAAAPRIAPGFTDPSIHARSHRWACAGCRRWASSSYSRKDPSTWIDPDGVEGVVSAGLAAAAVPTNWVALEEQDRSRVPSRILRAVTMPPSRPRTTVIVTADHVTDPASEDARLSLGHAREIMSGAAKGRELARAIATRSSDVTKDFGALPEGTLGHPTTIAWKQRLVISVRGRAAAPLRDADLSSAKLSEATLRVEDDKSKKPRLIMAMNTMLNTITAPPTFRFASVPAFVHEAGDEDLFMSLDESAAYYSLYVLSSQRRSYCFTVVDETTGEVVLVEPSVCGFGSCTAPAHYVAVKANVVSDVNRAAGAAGPDARAAMSSYMDDSCGRAAPSYAGHLFRFS